MKRKLRWIVLPLVLAALAVGAFGVYRLRRVQAAGTLPTAPVRKGEFLVIVRCRGELKARRSVQVTAPVNVPDLRIVWLAQTGGMVNAEEPVIRFDPSSAKQNLQEKDAALKQAQAALDQAVAQARIDGQQDKLDFATATYEVEKAKLEVSKAEIVSAIQAEESKIELGLAQNKRGVKEASNQLNEVSNEAKIASLTRARDKARDEVALFQYRVQQMEIKAPLTGLVNYLPNYSQGWVNAKPFKVGDQVWPGAAIIEIPDLATLEMEGKVDEIDRGRISVAQDARVRIDSLPEITFPAKLLMISPMTVMGWEWPPTRSFRGFAKLDKSDQRLRPGMNGAMDVVVNRLANAISIPSKALFTREGKPIVYVPSKEGYQPVQVEVLARNPDEIAIKGISENARVTLVEPEKKERKS